MISKRKRVTRKEMAHGLGLYDKGVQKMPQGMDIAWKHDWRCINAAAKRKLDLRRRCKGYHGAARIVVGQRIDRHQSNELTSVVMGLLTGPHQTSFSEDSSLTIRLSEGERPVLAPE